MRSARREQEPGFTLIELLVVVAIMMVLIGMVMGAVSIVRQYQRRVLATKHVHDIVSSAEAYAIMLNQYPADTGMVELDGSTADFTADDPAVADSIYMCLGRKVYESATDSKFGNFLLIHPTHLRTIAGMEIMVDPWGTPYRMDSIHVRSAPGAAVAANQADYVAPSTSVSRVGAPYGPAVTIDKQTYSVKAWSVGPDKQEGATPFSHIDKITDPWDEDNISSWR